MKKYFFSSSVVKINPPVNIYPYDETISDSVYEGQWVIAKTTKIVINEKQEFDVTKQIIGIEDISDILRGWSQNLQMISLSNMKDAENYAKISLEYANELDK